MKIIKYYSIWPILYRKFTASIYVCFIVFVYMINIFQKGKLPLTMKHRYSEPFLSIIVTSFVYILSHFLLFISFCTNISMFNISVWFGLDLYRSNIEIVSQSILVSKTVYICCFLVIFLFLLVYLMNSDFISKGEGRGRVVAG